jgi:hypothetical protein
MAIEMAAIELRWRITAVMLGESSRVGAARIALEITACRCLLLGLGLRRS